MINITEHESDTTIHAHGMTISVLAVQIGIINLYVNAPQNLTAHLSHDINPHNAHPRNHAHPATKVDHIQISLPIEIILIDLLIFQLNKRIVLPKIHLMLNLNLKSICITKFFILSLRLLVHLLHFQKILKRMFSPFYLVWQLLYFFNPPEDTSSPSKLELSWKTVVLLFLF